MHEMASHFPVPDYCFLANQPNSLLRTDLSYTMLLLYPALASSYPTHAGASTPVFHAGAFSRPVNLEGAMDRLGRLAEARASEEEAATAQG
jgi:hypothetical protein